MNTLTQILYTVSYMILPLFLAMVFHEYAHGRVAYLFGDRTASDAGRLTLNPLRHIDPVGTVMVPLLCLIWPIGIFFGWAKPVPVNAARLRKPRRHMALVALAGPAMNLILAVASGLLFSIIFSLDPSTKEHWPPKPGMNMLPHTSGVVLLWITAVLYHSVFLNLLLMVFNLIPIPPLDGGRVLLSLLPSRAARVLRRFEPYGMMVLMMLIVLDPQIGFIHTVIGTFVPMMANMIFTHVQVI